MRHIDESAIRASGNATLKQLQRVSKKRKAVLKQKHNNNLIIIAAQYI